MMNESLMDKLTAPRRIRVLHISYACSPFENSEPAVGWNRAFECARECDVWVICCEEFREPIERYLRSRQIPKGLNFAFVGSKIHAALMRVPGLFYLGYRLWHALAVREAKRLHNQHDFDIVHQVNLCGFREPGYGTQLGIPFVWGPVGGTQNFPMRFLSTAGLLGGTIEILRTIANRYQLRFRRRVRGALLKSKRTIAANSTNQRDLESVSGRKIEQFFEAGTHPQPNIEKRFEDRAELRIVWSGRLEAWKAFPLLLQALSRLPADFPFSVRVIGDGSRRKSWQRLANSLGIGERIAWRGSKLIDEAREEFEWGDVLVFTSLRDTTGSALFQALEVGLPVICFDHQGARDVIDARCGVKLSVESPKQAIHDLRATLIELHNKPELLNALHRGAVERAQELSWENIGKQVCEIYQQITNLENTFDTVPTNDQVAISAGG